MRKFRIQAVKLCESGGKHEEKFMRKLDVGRKLAKGVLSCSCPGLPRLALTMQSERHGICEGAGGYSTYIISIDRVSQVLRRAALWVQSPL